MSNIKPVIKWSGSKRLQAAEIRALIPAFRTYFEPFLGGGSVLYAVTPARGICADICEPLIDLWNAIKQEPDALADAYETSWRRLQNEGHPVYYEIRDRFNRTRSAQDLLFLSRTCVNGLIRFNKEGVFNNSLHHTRRGIRPDSLRAILLDWSARVQPVSFRCLDYKDSTAAADRGDFVYLDPPYFHTKGRYYGTSTIDFDEFFRYLEDLNRRGVRWALSFDGRTTSRDYSVALPAGLYRRHLYLSAGSSSFQKVMEGENHKVQESLYLNY